MAEKHPTITELAHKYVLAKEEYWQSLDVGMISSSDCLKYHTKISVVYQNLASVCAPDSEEFISELAKAEETLKALGMI